MARIAGEIVIRRPVEEVFDFVADERNEPRYNPHMAASGKLTDGPVGPGTRFRATMLARGRTIEMVTELVEFQRPDRLRSKTTMPGMDIDGTLRFEPIPEGTRMRWDWSLRPRGPLRLASPLVAWMGRRQERRIWTSLKDYLEAGQDAQAPP